LLSVVTCRCIFSQQWRRSTTVGVVALVSINVVALRRARLVLGWVIACGPCAVSRDRVVGVIRNHIFGISDPNLPIHYITFMGLLRKVYMGACPNVYNINASFTVSKIRPKNGGYSGITGCKC